MKRALVLEQKHDILQNGWDIGIWDLDYYKNGKKNDKWHHVST
jgi:hypothetical protein